MKVLRRSITAAEDDYIRIGNRLYPKNAMDYPEGMTADQVSREATRRRNAEIEQEKAEEKRRAEAERGEKLRQAVEQAKAEDDDPATPLSPYFKALVPAEGAAESVAGELVRAMMRILYRDWNDGDRFFSGYGIETCASSAQYLMDNGPDEISRIFEAAAEADIQDDAYTESIEGAADVLIDYIDSHPELYGQTNEDDSREWDIDEIEAMMPLYDYDFSIPDEVLEHIERGNIDSSDLEWEISSWDAINRSKNAQVTVFSDSVDVTGLSEEEFEELEGHGYEYLESYGRSLTEEYGDPWEDEDDYDDELDEEYDEVEESTQIKASSNFIHTEWCDLNGAEQMAVEYAHQYMKGPHFYDLEMAAYKGANQATEGNYEPEYENEEFYGEEADAEKVLNYLLTERGYTED